MKLSEAAKILKNAGVDNFLGEARQIFSRYEKFSTQDLLLSDPDSESETLAEAVRRRAKREPLQYIFGEAYFYNEIYRVTPDVLIPRQDTEIIVEAAVKNLPYGVKIADLCTGSGCIAISVLKNRPDITALCVDISDSVLAVARENAAMNRVSERAEFLRADILEEHIDITDCDVIISNPPYINGKDMENLQKEVVYEPRTALFGGGDGFVFYRRIVSEYKNAVSTMIFEIGYSQADGIEQIAGEHGFSCEVFRDYSGNCRMAVLKKQKKTAG